MNTEAFLFIGLIGLLVIGSIFIWCYFYYLVIQSAKKKNRSGCWWFFLSLFFTPVFCLIILHLLGAKEEETYELEETE